MQTRAAAPKGAKEKKKTRRKARGEGADRRREIVEAARFLMARDGYEKTSIRAIADRVGVSSTALYVYFPDKEALFREVCHASFLPLVNASLALLAEDGDLLERFRRGLRTYVDWGLDHPEEYSLVFLNRIVEVEPYDHRQPLVTPGPDGEDRYNSFALLVEAVKQLMDARLIAEDDPFVVAELVWMAVHGLVAAVITRPMAHFTPREELVQGMVDLVMGGLLARRPG
jgi:AcrR family transcriptional regulator